MAQTSLVPITLPADPANALEASTKQYTDLKVSKSGDTSTGNQDIWGSIVGRVWNGTYYGIQATPVGTAGSSGSALMLGSTGGNKDTFLIATAGGKVQIRPNNDVAKATNFDSTQVTLTTPLVLPANPTNALEASTKQYVDTRAVPAGGTSGDVLTKTSGTDYAVGWAAPSGGGGIDQTTADARYVNVDGDTMTNNLNFSRDYYNAIASASGLDICAPDNEDTPYGGAITSLDGGITYGRIRVLGSGTQFILYIEGGLLALSSVSSGTVRITGVTAPTAATDAANKSYVDARTPKVTVSTTAPSSPAVNDIWVDLNG